MLAVEREAAAAHLGRDQRVDDDDARVALDERHVREVEATHLVDAVGDLEQAVRSPPAAPAATGWGARCRAARPSRNSYGTRSQTTRPSALPEGHRIERGDETPLGVLEVRPILEIQSHLRCSPDVMGPLATAGFAQQFGPQTMGTHRWVNVLARRPTRRERLAGRFALEWFVVVTRSLKAPAAGLRFVCF